MKKWSRWWTRHCVSFLDPPLVKYVGRTRQGEEGLHSLWCILKDSRSLSSTLNIKLDFHGILYYSTCTYSTHLITLMFFLILAWRNPQRRENCISDLSVVLKKVYGVRTWDWEEKREKRTRHESERPLLKEGRESVARASNLSRCEVDTSNVGIMTRNS